MAILEEHNVQAQVIEYLNTPPDQATLESLLSMLGGLEPRQLMRQKETEYKEQNLENPELSREQLIQAMISTPKLIERPIVVNGDKAIIGRPPENVLSIL